MAVNSELVEILACPQCKGKLILTEAEDGLICDQCKVIYPIREEIPIMLIEEAVPEEKWGEKGEPGKENG
jgi:hypothetical protein